jgi:ketosteroid isomerase-like protein
MVVERQAATLAAAEVTYVPTGLRATDPVMHVFGDVALVRHVLLVAWPPESGQPEQRICNTSVWRKLDSRWLCVHNHEDLLS